MAALDDLVRAGKVRYVGFSDTPAWIVAQAQTMAQFRGWAPLIALQIEYSLIQRTVEGELMPMAAALGLGVTPWSPLGGGALSGKYDRHNTAAQSPGRAATLARNFTERTFAIIDCLKAVAARHQTSAARVALAWVLARHGVSSPILGARTMAQLDDNLAALDLVLQAQDIAELDEASAPTLNFPAAFLEMAQGNTYSGMTINGRSFEPSVR